MPGGLSLAMSIDNYATADFGVKFMARILHHGSRHPPGNEPRETHRRCTRATNSQETTRIFTY